MNKSDMDRVLVATVQFNKAKPGQCDMCGQDTQQQRAVSVAYSNDLSDTARLQQMSAGATEQEVVDQHFQQVAARQLRGELGPETRRTLCATCAGTLIDLHMSGGLSSGDVEESELLRRVRATGEPIFVGLCIDVERGPQGQMLPTCVLRVDAAVDPLTILQAAPPLRAGDAPVRVKAPDTSAEAQPKQAPKQHAKHRPPSQRKPNSAPPPRLSRRRRRQPATNLGQPGKVLQAYPDLFPDEWRELGEKLRQFDTAWFKAHPTIDAFAREYVPGESYPQHDPASRYVVVKRLGDLRVRTMSSTFPDDLPWVELPETL